VPVSIMSTLARQYCETQEAALDLVDDLTDGQLAWSPNETTPSIGFHVWHLARWADYLQEMVHGRGSQIWEREGLAARWELATEGLGYAQTGMSMDDTVTNALSMPGKAALMDYARRAFALAQQAVAAIDDEAFHRVYAGLHGEHWHDGRIGPIIATWMTHDNRHLGMIECLIGIQGMHGTADS